MRRLSQYFPIGVEKPKNYFENSEANLVHAIRFHSHNNITQTQYRYEVWQDSGFYHLS